VIRLLPAAIAGTAVLACATPYAKLDGVLVDTRPALPTEGGRVTVVRDNARRNGQVKESVVKGETMLTARDGAAILTIRPGYEVIVEPGTELNIENPSIFLKIGKLFLKKLRQAKEALRLNTEFVSAGVEGTEFIFEVLPDGTVHIAVVEGAVVVRPRQAGWAPITYLSGDEGFIRRGLPPGRVQRLDPNTSRAIRARALAVERAVNYNAGQPWSRFTPLWQKPVFFVPALAVGVGATVFAVSRGGNSRTGAVIIQVPF
jgi:FecR-like protein